jgi:hypothetical protein
MGSRILPKKTGPSLGEVYGLKEAFYAIYEKSDSPENVLRRYEAWSKEVSSEIGPCFHDIAYRISIASSSSSPRPP